MPNRPRADDIRRPIRRSPAHRLAHARDGPAFFRSCFRAVLRGKGAKDAAAGRTTDGPHLTDLAVIYEPKNISAADASTGEQKTLLIGLVLAHAGLIAEMTGSSPLLLLDEVVAHLDPARRGALYAALAALGAQVFMTGADPTAFADIANSSDRFAVSPGAVARALLAR